MTFYILPQNAMLTETELSALLSHEDGLEVNLSCL